MRFMILRKADAKTEAGVMPGAALLAAMGKFMEETAKSGMLLAGDGLQASAKGARVSFANGVPTVVDGPFDDPATLVAGFCIIQATSKREAIDWVKRWPSLDGDGAAEIEIRQMFEAEDFGAEFTEEQRQSEACLRAELAARTAKAG